MAATRTNLDILLDRVKAKEHEVTFDLDGYTQVAVDLVIDAATKRGFHAAFDGRFLLVRDLR